MNWAWLQALKLVPKLVLMALADAADDQGVCWPSDTTPGQVCQGAPDTGVIPGTTIGTQRESPQPLMSVTEQSDRGGGELSDLEYPRALLPAERSRAEAMVAVLARPLSQQVLDEWAGIITAGEIRASSLGCLRALVKRAQQGTFAPERALRVAQARKVRQRAEAAQAQVELPEPAPIDEDNPLVRRLMDIAQRSGEK
jgi:hypothetical protein